MLRTISLVFALSFIGAVAAIELRDAVQSLSCPLSAGLAKASVPQQSQRPRPRPRFAVVAMPGRDLANPIPLSEWAEAVDLDLRHSLSF